MMKKYDPKKIEQKWQKYWEKNKTFEVTEDKTKDKFYGLIEFPYPSAEGLHVGHPRPFTAMDVISRKKRMEGKNVLFPIGFDAFGLPTENFAIKTGKAPAEVTKKNIANFTRQLKMLGFSFDWSRQVDTTDPNYYRWTQWLFLQFFKHGLAYKKSQPINWCPKDKIGLANEEVVGGCCERCGTQVETKNKEQWMLAITKYADKLLEGLKNVDYIERARVQQENWIGRSEGAEVIFPLRVFGQADGKHSVKVFTTRPDTIFGVTFVAISAELAKSWLDVGWTPTEEVKNYITEVLQSKTTINTREEQEKTGVNSGVMAINPVSKAEVPVWITNYVMGGVGTGAIMGVPAHDERDFDFAKKFGLPIRPVVMRSVVVAGSAAPKQGKQLTQLQAVTGIIHNPKNDSFLLLRRADGDNSFVGGSIEEGENAVAALHREIIEETGYTDFEIHKSGFPNFFGNGYKLRTDKNCLAFENYYAVELLSEQRQEVDQEEMVKHEPFWVPRADVSKTLTLTTHQYMWSQYEQQKPKYLIFDFDGVIGDTLEDGVKINMLLDSLSEEEARKNIDNYYSRKPDHAKGHSLNSDQLEKQASWIKKYGEEMLKLNPPLFDGFIEAIKNLPNTKIAVISAGSGVYIKNRIPDTGLNPTHVLTYDDHHSKEEKIEQVCKDWGISMQDVYYFTDTKADIYELENCLDRKKLIGCAWGHAGYDGLRELLPEEQVLKKPEDINNLFADEVYIEDGVAVNSDFLNGLQTGEAKEKMISWLEENKVGKRQVNYKLRDWVFSRQRYWGEPIPLVFCENCAKDDSQGYTVELKKASVWNRLVSGTKIAKGFAFGKNQTPVEFRVGQTLTFVNGDEIRNAEITTVHKFSSLAQLASATELHEKLFDTTGPLTEAELTKLYSEYNSKYPEYIAETGLVVCEFKLQPVKYKGNSGWIPLPESELPLKLPKVEKYQPTDTGESPLAAMEKWVKTKCPQCGGPARRETDTMPNWAGSSWYFLRYCDPDNDQEFASMEKLKYWLGSPKLGEGGGVDWYNGGMEHTVLHLLYSRFWNIFLHDIGLVPTSEPYKKRTSHGMILAKGGEKMSKSKGNVVNPDEMVEKFGADALRTYIMFMGPFDQAVEWDTNGLVGVRRFLEKVWGLQGRLVVIPTTKEESLSQPTDDRQRSLGGVNPARDDSKVVTLIHQTIKKVSEDIEAMRFNTAIAKMMELVNEMSKQNTVRSSQFADLIKILSPFAPHLCEEIWGKLGNENSLVFEPWPQYNETLTKESEITLAVQVNGKLRDTIIVQADISEDEAKKIVLASEKIQKWLEGKEPKKVIYVKGKLVSIVV